MAERQRLDAGLIKPYVRPSSILVRGGISEFLKGAGCSLNREVGTGFFECLNCEGGFDREQFAAQVTLLWLNVIEINLSEKE